MCTVLNISESVYYQWLRNRGKLTRQQFLLVEIKKILDEHPDNDNYGSPRMHIALSQKGITVSREPVYRAMKAGGYIHRRRNPHGLTKAATEIQEKENLIKRDFHSDRPMAKLLTDITEVQCLDGKLYVSPIMDCYNGEILALKMRENMKKELCIDTVRQMSAAYGKLQGAVLHSDRGSQYTSEAFQNELRKLGIRQSLSSAGQCYDNARMESFFATLKKEKLYRIPTYKMPQEEVKTAIFRYIFVYYNRIRVYTGNPGGLALAKYREAAKKTVAAA